MWTIEAKQREHGQGDRDEYRDNEATGERKRQKESKREPEVMAANKAQEDNKTLFYKISEQYNLFYKTSFPFHSLSICI